MKVGLLLAAGLLLQAPRVTTTLSSDRVAPGERFEIVVEVETDGRSPEITFPGVPPGVEIEPGRMQRRTVSAYPNGNRTLYTQRFGGVAYVEGRFRIPGPQVLVGGRRLAGAEVVVQVGTPPPATAETLANPARLVVSVTPSTAYVGQAVTLRADAMLPRELRARLTRPATYEPPLAPGFWVVDLPNPLTVGLERIGGDLYEVQTYRRVYVPIVPGRHVLRPARLSYEMRAGLLQPPEAHAIESDSVAIEVKPLPESGRPPGFAGAVGRYTLEAALDPPSVAVGEAAVVRVSVRGRGNVKAIPAPDLPVPSSLELLPPGEETSEDPTGSTLGGVKEFRWAVVPREAGRVTLGPIVLSYFDPDAGEYRVLRSDSLVLDVAGFSGSDEAQGLRPPDYEPSPPRLGFVRSRAFLIAQAVPLFLLFAGFARGRKPRPERRPREPERTAGPGVEDLIAAARHGEAGVLDRLAERLRSIPSDGRSAALDALLGEVDAARFAPRLDPPAAARLVERARALLEGPPAARRGGTVAPALLLGLGLGLPAVAVQSGAFDHGIMAFAKRDAATARAAFEAYVREEPRDASGWYDLGNAAYRVGDRGAATHAWLTALGLDPRHGDARHNLVTVAGTPTERFLPSRLSLGDDAAILAAALAWWLAGILSVSAASLRRGLLVVLPAAWLAIAGAWRLGRSGPELVTTRTDGTAIHGEPALQSAEVRRFPAGEPLEIRDRAGAWLRVRSAVGEEGWLEATAVRLVAAPAGARPVH